VRVVSPFVYVCQLLHLLFKPKTLQADTLISLLCCVLVEGELPQRECCLKVGHIHFFPYPLQSVIYSHSAAYCCITSTIDKVFTEWSHKILFTVLPPPLSWWILKD
jgi:hypothetical protein